ncbi:hypothetical protein TWF730_006551 [Orbilia blumenaviensis]|uniref:CHAT domain-containing protein n=1 Tax=Orbilia blumenaviensis TaxID=1796055 RepID=A0AAV9VGY0_9PEZI
MDNSLARACEILEKLKNRPEDGYACGKEALMTAGVVFGAKYCTTGPGELSYLESAIKVNEAAVKLIGPSKKYTTLDFIVILNLSTSLCKFYAETRVDSVAERAISYLLEALNHTNPNPPEDTTYHCWSALCEVYYLLHRFTQNPSHLEASCQAIDQAISMNHHRRNTGRGAILYRAGLSYSRLYKLKGETSHLDTAVGYLEEGMTDKTVNSFSRLKCAVVAARKLLKATHAKGFSEAADWERPLVFLKAAIGMLSKVNLRSISSEDMQDAFSGFGGLAYTAAAVALEAKKTEQEAFELLERGRSIIAGFILDLRTDLSELQRKRPDLAVEFISIAEKLDSTEKPITSMQAPGISKFMPPSSKRLYLNEKFDNIVEKIRSLTGFQNFLQPVTLDEIKSVLNQDPIVIINASLFRCDAFIIDPRRLQETQDSNSSILSVIRLPKLSISDIKENVKKMRGSGGMRSSILKWLWDVAASPILEYLGFSKKPLNEAEWPHVQWVLTGPLSHLPIHAAGDHATEDTVLDRVISSYASSVRSIVHSSRRALRNPEPSAAAALPKQLHSNGTAILISMKTTPGLPTGDLRYADEEVEILKNLCPDLGLKPLTPDARHDDVLASLPDCKIFHFAGHGESNARNPSQSHLLLEDHQTKPLTMANLRAVRLQEKEPFLAYLSACSTSTNLVDDFDDEGINLTNAFQLAGFRHVIGTLWSVSDRHCVQVAKTLYNTLKEQGMNDAAVRWGLHRAIRELRDDFRASEKLAKRAIEALTLDETEDDAEDVEDTEARVGYLVGAKKRPRPAPQLQIEDSTKYWAPYIHVGI